MYGAGPRRGAGRGVAPSAVRHPAIHRDRQVGRLDHGRLCPAGRKAATPAFMTGHN